MNYSDKEMRLAAAILIVNMLATAPLLAKCRICSNSALAWLTGISLFTAIVSWPALFLLAIHQVDAKIPGPFKLVIVAWAVASSSFVIPLLIRALMLATGRS